MSGDGRYQAQYDLDANGVINFSDFLMFASRYGQQVPPSGGGGTPTTSTDFDLDGNGIIGVSDFLIFVNSYGEVSS